GYFSAGVEVVLMRSMVRGQEDRMSSGVGCFEQLKAILEYRGVSDLDIPVLALGIKADNAAIVQRLPTQEDIPDDLQ
ncbi:MAG: hypothetical protein ACRDHE_17235, partial [Ktedonobacterales bacterium]